MCHYKACWRWNCCAGFTYYVVTLCKMRVYCSCAESPSLVLQEEGCLCLLVGCSALSDAVGLPRKCGERIFFQLVQAQSSQWQTCRQVNREGGPLYLAASQPLTPHVLLLRPCYYTRRRRCLFSTKRLICAMLALVFPELGACSICTFQCPPDLPSVSGGVDSALITFFVKYCCWQ